MDETSTQEIIDVDSDTSIRTLPYDTNDSSSGDQDIFSRNFLPDISCVVQKECAKVVTLSDCEDVTNVKMPYTSDTNYFETSKIIDSNHSHNVNFSLANKSQNSSEGAVKPVSCSGLSLQMKIHSSPQRAVASCIDISSSSDEEVELVPLKEKIRKKFDGNMCSTIQELLGCHSEQKSLHSLFTNTKSHQPTYSEPSSESDDNRNQKGDLECDRNEKVNVDCELPKLSDLFQLEDDVMYAENGTSHLDVLEPLPIEDEKFQKGKLKSEKLEMTKHKEEERQRKKKEKEVAKALRDAEREAKQNNKPKESLKLMQVILDRRLMEHNGAGDLLNALQALDVKYMLGDQVIPCSVTWQKTITEHTVTNELQVSRNINEEAQDQLVILLPLLHFLQSVHTFTQNKQKRATQNDTILDQILKLKTLFPSMHLTYIVMGLEQYFSKQRNKENQQFKSKVRGTRDAASKRCLQKDSFPNVSRVDVEEAMIDAQIQGKVNFKFVPTMTDVGNFIAKVTKAIAEAPLKKIKQKQQGFSWYAEGDSSRAVKVDKTGQGLTQLWQQQICQFSGVGKEVAQAIASHYSCPQALLKAYKACLSPMEAEKLLQDILVRRGIGPLATSRRVGPELSHKVHLFFTSTDGNILLQRS